MSERLASRLAEKPSLRSRMKNVTLAAVIASSSAGGPTLTLSSPVSDGTSVNG